MAPPFPPCTCGECKVCHRSALRREYSRRYSEKNPEKKVASKQKARAKNQEIYRKHSRTYYYKNKEKYGNDSEARRKWREEHPEYLKTWKKNNSHKVQEYRARRRALERDGSVEKLDYEIILRRDGYWCYLCKEPVEKDDVHFDHVVPLSKGGEHKINNIRVTHSKCNLSKGSKLPPG